MRRKLSTLAGLLLVLAVVAVPVGAITWGEPDTVHTNVGAMVVDWPGYGPFQVCTGTLIHPRVFLTAGHCTSGWEGTGVTTFWVNFDQNALNEATLLDVEEVITDPDYNWGPTSNPHDVGALILAEPVNGITPATLPEEGFLNNLRKSGALRQGREEADFTVVGYGGSLDWPPPEIYYEDQRQVAYSEFQALLKSWLLMSQNQATGDGGTCFGDSGGPAFWTEPDGSEVLVGITSWGDSNCVASGFDYRVDTADTLDFIDSVIAGLGN
jgi:secreted trypsin-like serine protease